MASTEDKQGDCDFSLLGNDKPGSLYPVRVIDWPCSSAVSCKIGIQKMLMIKHVDGSGDVLVEEVQW